MTVDYNTDEEEKINVEEILNSDLEFQEWISQRIKEAKEIQIDADSNIIDN